MILPPPISLSRIHTYEMQFTVATKRKGLSVKSDAL